MPRRNATHIRFVVTALDADSTVSQGLFHAVTGLRDRGEMPDYDARRLKEILEWFDDNLDLPERFNRTKSKGAWRRAAAGVSWFKASASEHIAKMRELAAVLGEHGYHVVQLETDRPGFIVYQDDHQIVAEPFADTPAMAK